MDSTDVLLKVSGGKGTFLIPNNTDFSTLTLAPKQFTTITAREDGTIITVLDEAGSSDALAAHGITGVALNKWETVFAFTHFTNVKCNPGTVIIG